MAEPGEEKIRALMRLIPPVRALKQNLEKSLVMERYAGTGNLAVKSFQALRESVARIGQDPYVGALSLEVSADATDEEKVSLVLLAAEQLAAYLEGQTGLVGFGGEGSGTHIQTAPNLEHVFSGNVQIHGAVADEIAKLARSAVAPPEKATEEEAEGEAEQGADQQS